MQSKQQTELFTKNLLLKPPEFGDEQKVTAFYRNNWEHLETWEPGTGPDLRNEETVKNALLDWTKQQDADTAIRFLMQVKEDNNDKVIGIINLTQIFRGPFQAGYLGFKISKDFEGKGFMREALEKVIEYAFGPLNLHRIMANHLPTNIRSAQLLKRLGFSVEGYARDYLRIRGKWADHVLTALTNHQWEVKL